MLAGLIVAVSAATGAWGADDPAAARERLDDVRGAIEREGSKKSALESQSARQAAELDRLRTELSAAASTAQAHEAEITSLESDLRTLAGEKELKIKALTARKGQLGDTLAALQRMSLRPD